MYNIIAIERQYASGGNEIGRKLAKALGYKLYDRNILAEAAKNLGISHIYIENLEETGPGSTIFNLSKTSIGNSLSPDGQLSLAEKLFLEEKKIIERAAEEGNCIIVGRAAGYILRDRTDCLTVFIHADKVKRMDRAISHEGIKESEAVTVLKRNDKRRKSFYDTHTTWEWGNPSYFSICLDSGKLGIELATSMLICTIKEAAQLKIW